MDQSTFDRVARLLGGSANRRAGIRVVLAAAFGVFAAEPAAAKRGGKAGTNGQEGAVSGASSDKQDREQGRGGKERDRRPATEGPCGDGSIRENLCKRHKDCCTGYCQRKHNGKKGAGRCRCKQGGRPCTADRNCCNGSCVEGFCVGRPTPPDPPATIPTGTACLAERDTCADANASCIPYDRGTKTGTYCLLPFEAECMADDECVNASCSLGVCVGCSCKGCDLDSCEPDVCSSCTHTTIQDAIDAAASGDIIRIAPGTYSEDLAIEAKHLTLVGCPGGEVIIRNQTIATRTITVSDTSRLELVDIVVQGNNNDLDSYGGGIETLGSATLCRYTQIRGNRGPDSYGGGIWVKSDVSAPVLRVLDATVISGNRGAYGGGIAVQQYATLIVDGHVVIRENKGDTYGGGVYLDPGARAVIRGNSQLVRNTAANHAAISFYGGSSPGTVIELSGNVLIDDNESDSYGGGIGTYSCDSYGTEKIVISENVKISNNRAAKGGGIASGECRVFVSGNVKLTGNSVTEEGGAIYASGQGDSYGIYVHLTDDVEISSNHADSYAGGVRIDGAPLQIDGRAVLTLNSATKGGGAIYGEETSIFILESAKLTGNSTDSYGGAIYSTYNPLSITGDVEISGNTGGYGGAIAVWRVYDSYSAFIGGDVKITGNTAKIKGSAPGQGGAIFAMNSNVVLARKADVSGNTAEGEGGGVALVKDTIGGVTDPANLEITGQASITGNTSSVANGGGGVWAEDTASVVTAPAGSISSNTPDQCVGSSSADCTA